MQWNDLRDDVGTTVGVYDNRIDLTDQSSTVMRFSEVQRDDGTMEWLIRKDGCMHSEDPGCLEAYRRRARSSNTRTDIVDCISENRIGCGYCIAGCPFDIPRISKQDNKAYKCSLCSDRVAIGMSPACVKLPTGALQFGARTTWSYAAKNAYAICRSADFRRRLYNPQGVDGTQVMYVMQHADRPELYNNLQRIRRAARRSVSGRVSRSRLRALVLGVAALGAFFHYVTRGPKEVDESADSGHGPAHATIRGSESRL